jgi:hypothetical protein
MPRSGQTPRITPHETSCAAKVDNIMEKLAKAREVCAEIAKDMAEDAKNFDGRPFNGRTGAVYFGNQGAAIAALAGIIGLLIDEAAILNNEVEAVKLAHP